MASDFFKKIFRVPFFLYLLPFFFVLHGFTENYFLVPVPDSFFLLLKYSGAGIVLNLLFLLIFKNNYKASFYSFLLLLVYFFFGAGHDALKSVFPSNFFSRYVFVMPFIFLLLIFAFIVVRRKKMFIKPTVYVNTVFIILILLEIFLLSVKISRYDRRQQLASIHKEFTLCDTCNKPDIYLIVMDEYAGEKTLNEIFDFDNSEFITQLKARNFHVVNNSFSNYNLTPTSIASLLNINYVNYKGRNLHDIAMAPVYHLIDTNILVPFLKFHGYEFFNNSVFTVNGQPPMAIQSFTPVSTRIIESQTLLNRLVRDLKFHFDKWKLLKRNSKDDYAVLNNNNKILKNIKDQVVRKKQKPLFSYTHLTMPHSRYYFNRHGQPYPSEAVAEGTQWNEEHYLEYLLYTNDVLIELLDFILNNSASPPVIILISDHGFRYFSKKVNEEYHFYNLNATYLPAQYEPDFTDSLSNISYMRRLMNTLFRQNLSADRQERFFVPMMKPEKSNLK